MGNRVLCSGIVGKGGKIWVARQGSEALIRKSGKVEKWKSGGVRMPLIMGSCTK